MVPGILTVSPSDPGVCMTDKLVPIFIPALVAVLLNREQAKGSPLTEDEVIKIRDSAECVMSPLDVIPKMAESRGYDDLDPEDVWNQWVAIRPSLYGQV